MEQRFITVSSSYLTATSRPAKGTIKNTRVMISRCRHVYSRTQPVTMAGRFEKLNAPQPGAPPAAITFENNNCLFFRKRDDEWLTRRTSKKEKDRIFRDNGRRGRPLNAGGPAVRCVRRCVIHLRAGGETTPCRKTVILQDIKFSIILVRKSVLTFVALTRVALTHRH